MALNNLRSQMLWENIRNCDLSAVVNLLENGTINLEERDENGQTFLMLACQQGDISLVRELLEAGIDPNATDNDNWTALLYAAKDGYLEICIELLERGADIEHREMCNWTALMWASYKGRTEVVQELLDREADPNVKAEHNMSCLCWAAGRGHTEIVTALIEKGAKVNSTDKYGTTPLIWACRKGHSEIVHELLNNGAYVDNTGMDSLTALLVASKGHYAECVQALLEYDPNVNALDKDGFTALTTAAKDGCEDIVQELLAKDAYVNVVDRAGDTILIHGVKGGYTSIVRALLNRYADVDVEGTDRKTALYWAVEKGHSDIVRLLLDNDADMEICTKDGDTPLMRAVRNRHELIVRLLLDKGAKVNVYDKKGDTALHISLRARSKRITELLLRNPRNSRLLYRPNKAGETPYNIDAYHQKSILTQIHGHRQLNASDGENLLGYEIYSSSLADILSEPTLNTPITVGLYAKWGSGKSFLIGKLKSEMKSFTKANDENQLKFSIALFIFLLFINIVVGFVLSLTVMYQVGLSVGFGLFIWEYGFLGLIWVFSNRNNIRFAQRISQAIGKRLQVLSLLLQVLFCNPGNQTSSDVPLVKFLFSESTKLNSVGGEKALGAMVAGLSDSVEKEFGVLSARLFGVIKQSSGKNYIGRFKTLCCIPLFGLVIFILLCLATGIALLVLYHFDDEVINGVMAATAAIVGGSLLINIRNLYKAFKSLWRPQRKRIMNAAENVHNIKIDGFMQVLKTEVSLMNSFVTSVDSFTKNTTRLVVVVDGLDSCEQEKVLQVLDIIHALFNEENSPFVVILAVDPQIIIKGIDQNLKSAFHDTNVNGFDYLRNIVHLPFYLQSQGISVKKQELTKSVSTYDVGHESPQHNHKAYRVQIIEEDRKHQESTVSQISGFSVVDPSVKRGPSQRQRQDSSTLVSHSNFDISHTLTKNDYFSDINPKSMRRLMNIVAVTGRLLRAYNIDFNWYRLAAWVNMVEQWPYRLSWIILYFEEHDDLDDDVTMKFIYDKIECQMPNSSEVEPLLEIDRNVRKLQAFLGSKSSSSPMLNISDLKKFLPCTINLDPYLRKLIRSFQSNQQPDITMGIYSPKPPNGTLSNQESLMSPRYRTGGNWTAGKQPMGAVHPSHMMPFGPMMNPYMMGMHGVHPYMMNGQGFGNPEASEQLGRKSGSPSKFITGYKGESLSKLSTEEVSALLERISGLNPRQLPSYQQAVLENNINGVVLSQCEIDDLGKCLEMKFGDWQLFKSAIESLRDTELYGNKETADIDKPESSGSRQYGSETTSGNKSIKFSNNDTTISRGSGSFSEADASSKSSKNVFKRQSTIEVRDGDAVPAFDTICEEDENNTSRTPEVNDEEVILETESPKRMKRNDSMVAEAIYESGLLQKFMHNFTDNLSEGDEEQLSDVAVSESSDLLLDLSDNAVVSKPKHTPVMFQLSADSTHSRDNVDADVHMSETEPLIHSTDSEPLILKSSTPVLKLPRLEKSGMSIKTASSETDLQDVEKSERNSQSELSPLMRVVRSVSTSSVGFTGGYSQAEMQSPKGSMDLVSVVDETSETDPGGPVDGQTLQKDIAQYISQASSYGAGLSGTGSQGVVVRQKDKIEGNTPEAFV
ncbi:kinase D-interacting substrate of 220 kDa B-like isoform X2 [Mya arenaria]|uniref:kinase D-interacting substrate of 220 kDa B-like isoform X2 n=1 Tax=Mya arenaria TaxID=6604 RepID=UPI0022E4A4AF|nr:kinase D-interacting substrate of 220 kDa B-like isoform X2 [Mya arenaria]